MYVWFCWSLFQLFFFFFPRVGLRQLFFYALHCTLKIPQSLYARTQCLCFTIRYGESLPLTLNTLLQKSCKEWWTQLFSVNPACLSMSNCLFLQGACHTLSYFVTLWDFFIWLKHIKRLKRHMNSYDSYDSMCVLLSIPLPQVLRDMSTSQEEWSVGVYAFYVFAFRISFCIFLFFVGLWTSLAVSNVQRWGCEPRIAE